MQTESELGMLLRIRRRLSAELRRLELLRTWDCDVLSARMVPRLLAGLACSATQLIRECICGREVYELSRQSMPVLLQAVKSKVGGKKSRKKHKATPRYRQHH